MTTHGSPVELSSQELRTSYHGPRSLVRLIQCSQCSYPFRTPVTLTCGHSLCRQCLPPPHARENISYPADPSRQSGITCPFPECQADHPLHDCSVNVVFLKVMDALAAEIKKLRAAAGAEQMSLEEIPQFPESPDDTEALESSPSSVNIEKAHQRTLSGGRLLATFTFAEMGELHYTSDVKYSSEDESTTHEEAVDQEILTALKDSCQEKVECHVCYNMLLDPVTTPCGHTFCRKCLARILDHSTLCPHCRRELYWAPALNHQPNDKVLSRFLEDVYPDVMATRREQIELEERSAPNGLNTPLFLCAVTYPSMPMVLHVFEPRYRLMIRRALESTRQFGMVAYNQHLHHQGDLGRTQFLETGTMLHIEQYDLLEDGRLYLLCRGLYRFKVQACGVLDGYLVGRVQRHDDVSLAEEERIEAEETSPNEGEANNSNQSRSIDELSTSQLFEKGQQFVERAQAQSAGWLRGNILAVYGPPPTDPALFPYWFASVVPVGEEEKYKLLPTNSVRERLKIMVGWIRKIESARW